MLRGGDPRDSWQRGGACGQMQKISAGKFHSEPPSRFTSLDHLVGASKQRDRKGKTKHLGCFEIDYQFDFRRSLDRQVCRLLALENTAGIYASLTIGIRGTACVAHQTAGYDRCARLEDRRHLVAKR